MLAERADTMRRHGHANGGEWAGACPWCGEGRDRFLVWPNHPSGHPRFYCRRCARSGDEIDDSYRVCPHCRGAAFLRVWTGKGSPALYMCLHCDAKMDFSQLVDPKAHVAGPARRVRTRTAVRTDVPATSTEPPLLPPPMAWQAAVGAAAQRAEQELWQPGGRWARDYLRGRGFTDDTIRAARLGLVWWYEEWEAAKLDLPAGSVDVHLPRGITIPWRLAGGLWKLKVRTRIPDPKQRYKQPSGGARNGLYGADGVRAGRPVVLVEGEFDALAILQAAGDLTAAVASGGTDGARHGRWVRLLASASHLLVAFDADGPGEQEAQWWLERISTAGRLAPTEHDAAAMLQAGKDLRGWVERALAAAK